MNRALSPYDLMVDMPTRTSEKLMKIGDRVTLCTCQHISRATQPQAPQRDSPEDASITSGPSSEVESRLEALHQAVGGRRAAARQRENMIEKELSSKGYIDLRQSA